MLGGGCKLGVFCCRQNASMAEDLLYLKQVNTGFNQVRGIAMAQTVWGNLFFTPQV